jgi:hypothetical protein
LPPDRSPASSISAIFYAARAIWGYGYDEIMGIDLGRDAVWQILRANYPALENMDVVRFTLDIDGAMDQIVATVDSAFGNKKVAAPAAI